ncbi:hypothetical protein RKD27_006745 [Streptomyces sp. SAI-126]|uniref:hypothetical protein n=1 Tax=unclassified Streptomyces TaxID=2593676 RepID=UPI001BAFD5D9|nr:hypothetical protein [Streptomyces sp. A2-16]QUC61292.1 hypothetical protein IOD14_33430 [Streptomyces sp. A2-16]
MTVVQRGAVLSVAVDGQPVVTFTDTELPYTRGRVGAYSEDATVEFEALEAVSGRTPR